MLTTTKMTTKVDSAPSSRRSSIRAVSYDGSETILSSAIRQHQWKNAIARAKHSPIEVSTWVYKTTECEKVGDARPESIRWKVLPIHQACERDPPLEVLKLFIEVFPEGVREFSHGGQLPLHCACQWAASPPVIAQLLMAYPESANVQDELKALKPVEFVKDSPCFDKECKKKQKTLELLSKGEDFWKSATWEEVEKILAGEDKDEEVKPSNVVDTDEDKKTPATSKRLSILKDETEGWLMVRFIEFH